MIKTNENFSDDEAVGGRHFTAAPVLKPRARIQWVYLRDLDGVNVFHVFDCQVCSDGSMLRQGTRIFQIVDLSFVQIYRQVTSAKAMSEEPFAR